MFIFSIQFQDIRILNLMIFHSAILKLFNNVTLDRLGKSRALIASGGGVKDLIQNTERATLLFSPFEKKSVQVSVYQVCASSLVPNPSPPTPLQTPKKKHGKSHG